MKRKKVMRAIILVFVVACIMTLFAATASAAIRVGSTSVTNYFQYHNSSGWHDLDTPQHYIANAVAYCIEHKRSSPHNSSYSGTDILGNYSTRTRTGLRIILENGYPYTTSGLSAAKARFATANAIRFWLSEQREPQNYNFMNFGSYSNARLCSYAANGQIGSKVRAKSGQTAVLQYSIELLIKARSQTLMPHDVSFSSMSMSISGNYFVGTTRVSLTNMNRGYSLNTGGLPGGSSVSGYTGSNGDTLKIRIPMNKGNSNRSFSIYAIGYDNRMRANMAAYDANSSSIQAVVTVVTGTSTVADTASFAVRTPAVPDLIVSALHTNKSSYEAGETVTITATVKNQGTGSTGAFKVSLSSSAISTQTKSISSLGVNASRSITFRFTAPTYTSNKNITLTAKVDSGNIVTELNEGNNSRSMSALIYAAKPDLIVSSLTTNKGTYDAGETVTVTAKVRNQGKIAVSACQVKLSFSYITNMTKTTSSIAVVGTATVTFTFTAPSFANYTTVNLLATADPSNRIAEINENNNTRGVNISVRAVLPDLTVASLESDKSSYEAGETVRVTAVAVNLGNKAISSTTMKLEISGIGTQSKAVSSLAANGGMRTIVFNFTAPTALTAQTITLRATIDPDNTVMESNESNNTRTATLGVKALRPDITIIGSTATDWYAGKEVVVSATVKNLTAQPAPSVQVRFAIGNVVLTESVPIAGNGSNLVVFRFIVPHTGDYTVTFTADVYNAIGETDENNNTWSKDISVFNMPFSIVLDPEDLEMEEQYSVYGLRDLPTVSDSNYHTWQEVWLENGSYVTKNYWARLTTSFEISPDSRIVQSDKPDVMESGFGIKVTCTTTLTTNYDHPEKLVGAQMVCIRYPESAYGQLSRWPYVNDSLEVKTGYAGDTLITWQLEVNLYSVTGSRLHYTPIWYPDGDYTALAQAFYAWSPVGQLFGFETDSVTISGDMYDRITTIKR